MSPSVPDTPARWLAAIVESSDDAIISKDLNGTITSWNRAAERIFGYTADEVIGKSIRIIIPADRQSEEDHVLACIRRGERVDHFETVRQRRDGGFVTISLTVSPIRSDDGVIVGASKVARDITAERQNAAALVEALAAEEDLQHRLRALVAASGDVLASPRIGDVLTAVLGIAVRVLHADAFALWRLDDGAWRIRAHQGVSNDFADQAVPMFQNVEAAPITFVEPLVVEDVDASILEERRGAFLAEGIRSLEVIPLRIRGQATGALVLYYRTQHTFSSVETETAQALGNMAAAALTTAELYEEARRRETDALRAEERASFLAHATAVLGSSLDSHETLRAIVKLAVPRIADWCAIDLVSDEGAIERVGVLHVDPEKTRLAQTILERYSDPSSPYSLQTVIGTGQSVMLPVITDDMIVAAAKGDEERVGLVRGLGLRSYICVPMRTHGRVVGAFTLVTADSGRIYTDADLRFAEDIASRAALAIDNARAYEETRRANQLKDEFLATLSHELRTPLNALLGYARMLRTGVLGAEKQARAFGILERNASTLSQIVADILDVSRIVSGKMRLDVVPVDLTAVVGDALASVLPAAEAKGVALAANLDPQGGGAVLGDGERLQQVVWNLASNAVKFTPKGGRVEVSIESNDSHAAIVVSDTGVGIAPDFLPHVFERFRQADSRLAREHGGLGLGLAISRHLVEMHGGTLRAFSEGIGRGATFRAELPLMPKPAIEDSAVGWHPTDGRHTLQDIRVLAVDDESDALTLVRDTLEEAGATVRTARSAEEALNGLNGEVPHVIISDLGLPTVDGLEFIRRVRASADPRLRALPAAALTAYARPEDRAESARAGFQVHLAKPIDPRTLVSAVSRLVGREGLPNDAELA